ncbi:hypothetical protein [Frankia sp. CiP3]|uniref:hypothetical protein n=1 Tax=Frankia sp. CiP3 TaxID=2880971 RepID=UPI001EF465E6|nr:hypothetical protein [Frankia sp. CiP3]
MKTRAASRELTRHLCAAVHLDSRLAAAVIKWVVEDRHRALAPVEGVDLVVVARHALAAHQRRAVRDVVLAATFVGILPFLFAFPSATSALLFLLFFVAWIVVLIEGAFTRSKILIRDLSSRYFDPEAAPEPSNPRLAECLVRVTAKQSENVIVYSGYSPFIGGGGVLDGWSVSVDTTKSVAREVGSTPDPFTVQELHSAVMVGLAKLQWVELKATERIFVSGLDVHDDRRFLADPSGFPKGHADPELVQRLLGTPEDTARHYTCIHISGWRGDLTATMYLRLAKYPENLFVEATWSILAPLKPLYQTVDSLPDEPLFDMIRKRIAPQALAATPWLLLRSILIVLAMITSPLRRAKQEKLEDKAIEDQLGFDYGAVRSVREMAADDKYHRYFQRLDKEMFVKTVQDRVLTTVINFLDVRGIDTSSLSEQKTTILNNGIMLSGQASLQAGSVAAGEHSKASTLIRRGAPSSAAATSES